MEVPATLCAPDAEAEGTLDSSKVVGSFLSSNILEENATDPILVAASKFNLKI